MERSYLRLVSRAAAENAGTIRRALEAFMLCIGIEEDDRIDILTACGEIVANAIEHAYAEMPPEHIVFDAAIGAAGFFDVIVRDSGIFRDRAPNPDRGFGLKIARKIAHELDIDRASGTCVRMRFSLKGYAL